MNRCIVLLLAGFLCLQVKAQDLPSDVSIQKIWDQGRHNAFTDLILFKGVFYCTFREGTGHIPNKDNKGNGQVRILRSVDGKKWESVALLEKEGLDLRDSKLSITPSGKLMVIMGGSFYNKGELKGRAPQVSFSNSKGTKFSKPKDIVIDPEIVSWGDWIWRVSWYNNVAYGLDYQIGPKEKDGPTSMYLVKSKDGKKFKKVSKIELDGFPNEATVRFGKDGTLYAVIRRETEDKMGVFAKSNPPYTDWQYTKLNEQLGGPDFLFINDEAYILGSRTHRKGIPPYTGIFLGNKNTDKLKEVLKLPSSGDNSYTGMVIHEGKLKFSYYSSHEGKTNIYFAEVPLKYFEK